ncbi:MAG TPA: hypothetical protein VF603_07115 [Allosphingosinicella sp.]|jgi:hypothetical protein
MNDKQKWTWSWAWANHPWTLLLCGALITTLLAIPSGLIVHSLSTRGERQPEPPLLNESMPVEDPPSGREPKPAPSPQAAGQEEPPAGPVNQIAVADPPAQPRTASPEEGASVEEPAIPSERRPVSPAPPPVAAPEPRLNQAGCPARQASLRFEWPERPLRAFISLAGTELVTLHDCDGGDFATLLEKEAGALIGLRGSWNSDFFQMRFGYRSDNAWGNIVCSVSADRVGERRYEGQMSCSASGGRRGSVQASTTVTVRL